MLHKLLNTVGLGVLGIDPITCLLYTSETSSILMDVKNLRKKRKRRRLRKQQQRLLKKHSETSKKE